VVSAENQSQVDFDVELPPEKFFGRVATAFSRVLGHIVTITLSGYASSSGLDSVLLRMVGHLGALYQLRHLSSHGVCLCLPRQYPGSATPHTSTAVSMPSSVWMLPWSSNSVSSPATNSATDCVIIQAPRSTVSRKLIFYYADIIGTLVGIVILFAVIIVWVAVARSFDSAPAGGCSSARMRAWSACWMASCCGTCRRS